MPETQLRQQDRIDSYRLYAVPEIAFTTPRGQEIFVGKVSDFSHNGLGIVGSFSGSTGWSRLRDLRAAHSMHLYADGFRMIRNDDGSFRKMLVDEGNEVTALTLSVRHIWSAWTYNGVPLSDEQAAEFPMLAPTGFLGGWRVTDVPILPEWRALVAAAARSLRGAGDET